MDDAVSPDEALLTPLFVKTSPPNVTAFSGMDVLVHALEAYVATAANNFTDALAQQAIELVLNTYQNVISQQLQNKTACLCTKHHA